MALTILHMETIPKSKSELEMTLLVARQQRRKQRWMKILTALVMLAAVSIMIAGPMLGRSSSAMSSPPILSPIPVTESSYSLYLPVILHE